MRGLRLVILLALGVTMTLVGCGVGAQQVPASLAPPSVEPTTAVSAAVAQTRLAIANALSQVGLQLDDATEPFRPSESTRLAAAPRAVYQVLLPADPQGGYVVVYEFRDAGAAVDAGNELAGYLANGAVRVQFPLDAQHVIRQVNTTLIFFTWSPAASPDPGTPKIAQALATLGTGFAVPR
jgi:hypothetical protein